MTPTCAISRRTMLRGLGVAVALPLLDAMLPRALVADEPAAKSEATPYRPTRQPVRMLTLFLPCGTLHRDWLPDQPGPLGQLKPVLKPLQALSADFSVLSGLWNRGASHDGAPHYSDEGSFLVSTVIKKTDKGDVSVDGISMDQVAARFTGTQTRLPSLHLNMQEPVGGGDSGYARMYDNQLSWSAPTTPVPNETDPKRAFERLFRSAGAASGKAAGVALALGDDDRRSVLDYVLGEAASLKSRVGVSDRRKLDEYLTAVRETEHQLDREIKEAAKTRRVDPAATLAVGRLGGALVPFDGRDHTVRTRLMLDILTLALWTDATRVATFMFGNGRNDINYSFIPGVTGTHHGISHYTDGGEAKMEEYRKINIWHSEQVAYFLTRLKGIKEGAGTLLDNSMVMYGGAITDGGHHGKEDLPILLAGRGGGALKPGRHIAFPKQTPLANLYLTMHQALGIGSSGFADSTRALKELVG